MSYSQLTILSVFILIRSISYADNLLQKNQTVYVYEKSATIWHPSDLGVTYKDCIIDSARTIGACDRRLDWPSGGTPLKVRRAAVHMNNKDYAYVKVGEKWGWTEVSYLSDDRTSFKKPAFLYAKPGFDYIRCKEAPSEMACKTKEFIKDKTKVEVAAPTEVTVKLENGEGGVETFVMVEYQSVYKGTVTGWVQKSSLSTLIEKSDDEADVIMGKDERSKTEAGQCVDCEIKKPKPVFEVIEDATKEIIGTSQTYKDERAFERYACIYSSNKNYPSGFSKDKFCRFYKGQNSNFKAQIAKAAKAFSLPPSLIGCTILVESAMYAKDSENKEYRGYGQFGRAAVDELARRVKSSPYKEQWKSYAPNRSTTDFNNYNIRTKNDVEISVGAVSMYLKWLLHEQIPNSKCRDCSGKSSAPTQKEIYMAIAGYNWSPFGLHKIAGKSPGQMRTGYPPPSETRKYFGKMDRCLAANNFSTFSSNSTSNEYKSRGAQCAAPCN